MCSTVQATHEQGIPAKGSGECCAWKEGWYGGNHTGGGGPCCVALLRLRHRCDSEQPPSSLHTGLCPE
eukprot:2249155-Amphidinium_carterae.1